MNEIGVFAMEERGLREVRDPSAVFLSREHGSRPGIGGDGRRARARA